VKEGTRAAAAVKLWKRTRQLVAKSGGHVIIGHNRYATHGTKAEEDMHPVESAHFAVVHNGIIGNAARLLSEWKMNPARVDTLAIVELLERTKGKNADKMKAAGTLSGSAAIAYIDKREPSRVYLYRDTSPLVVAYAPGLRLFLFASEETAIRRALSKSRIHYGVFTETLDTPRIVSFSLPEGRTLAVSPRGMRWHEAAETGYGGYEGYGFPRTPSYNTRQGGTWYGVNGNGNTVEGTRPASIIRTFSPSEAANIERRHDELDAMVADVAASSGWLAEDGEEDEGVPLLEAATEGALVEREAQAVSRREWRQYRKLEKARERAELAAYKQKRAGFIG
jgi:hypothetical protein